MSFAAIQYDRMILRQWLGDRDLPTFALPKITPFAQAPRVSECRNFRQATTGKPQLQVCEFREQNQQRGETPFHLE
ncbi:hypothetical protein [Symmachiella dynata]|uniref:hypothetical protein n=1 Tax=Symmachiella dynata TaxID=2527995 RepID=UPI0030EB7217